jgi:hypothetical protein
MKPFLYQIHSLDEIPFGTSYRILANRLALLSLAWVALLVTLFWFLSACAPNRDYIRTGEPCHADSCAVDGWPR